jgi:hypothetical protein
MTRHRTRSDNKAAAPHAYEGAGWLRIWSMAFNLKFCQRLVGASLLLPVGLLAGCGGGSHGRFDSQQEARVNAFPANYKPELLAYMHVYLNDPTNVRDAAASEPLLKQVGSRERYIVCLRFNAKQSSGQYAGVKTGLALFRNGRFDQFTEQKKEIGEACDKVDYQPFPELEKLSR